MNLSSVLHLPKSNFAFALNESSLVLRIKTAKNDCDAITLHFADRAYPYNPMKFVTAPMKKIGQTLYHDLWEVVLLEAIPRICYFFELFEGDESLYFIGGEFRRSYDCHRSEFFQYTYIHRNELFSVPEWFLDCSVYQIFPDSFATSKAFISDREAEVNGSHTRHGGSIKGITENLDYIQSLGVNCLYLNPINNSVHWHRYDVDDYYDIDSTLGTKEDFQELVEELHQRNMYIILDAVFNHCGKKFFAFEDVLEQGKKSKYWDWFYYLEDPVQVHSMPNYAAFAYEPHMPKLNTANPEVIDYFCEVGKYWINEFHIDGWRLDVANEVDHQFWRCFRKAVIEANPNTVLLGEVWETSNHYLDGTQFHSTMNYEFTRVAREAFAEKSLDSTLLNEKSLELVTRYPNPVVEAQLNLLDSHDVPRFMHWCQEDEKRLKMAIYFQFLFPGVPSMYMGDELGFSGLDEKEYRKPMDWKLALKGTELQNLYKKLNELRANSKIIRRGMFYPITPDQALPNGVVGFWRILPDLSKKISKKTLLKQNPALAKKQDLHWVHSNEPWEAPAIPASFFDLSKDSRQLVLINISEQKQELGIDSFFTSLGEINQTLRMQHFPNNASENSSSQHVELMPQSILIVQ